MTEQQIPKLVAALVEHQSAFAPLPTDDAQWVIQNTKKAIEICIKAIKNRPKLAKPLLDQIGTVEVPATAEPFIAVEKFVIGTDREAKVKISYLGANFTEWFSDKVEDHFGGSTLRYRKLRKESVDGPIITELGGGDAAETTLAELFKTLEMQPNGERGNLLINGWANVFYIKDKNGVLRAVICHWNGDGWRVDADPVGDPDGWNDGRQFFSRN